MNFTKLRSSAQGHLPCPFAFVRISKIGRRRCYVSGTPCYWAPAVAKAFKSKAVHEFSPSQRALIEPSIQYCWEMDIVAIDGSTIPTVFFKSRKSMIDRPGYQRALTNY